MQNTPRTATEQIIARDMAAQRKEVEARRVLHALRETVIMRAERPEDDEAVSRARVEFTMDSMAVIAKLVEAVDILWAIIYASDGCVGHRNCAHSMEPWERARDLLYRKEQREEDARTAQSPRERQDASPADVMRAHLETFGGKS